MDSEINSECVATYGCLTSFVPKLAGLRHAELERKCVRFDSASVLQLRIASSLALLAMTRIFYEFS